MVGDLSSPRLRIGIGDSGHNRQSPAHSVESAFTSGGAVRAVSHFAAISLLLRNWPGERTPGQLPTHGPRQVLLTRHASRHFARRIGFQEVRQRGAVSNGVQCSGRPAA